ncbi:hypothetical protein VFPPC_16386 [Pochonia chlamydosporia 170]|uniref:Uncharacterized protein n=1 Tax=Pochonia chlamydosporia 170 TaxID=1380566 RepID=A0A179FBC2_METCM|nr:hypothetical protein VFPPC_16386 [Pochonia chlamydosporia 170]OAQ62835.2 hypothetical protein VFPPC_16386 [Pochonia chlamydosporia 170]
MLETRPNLEDGHAVNMLAIFFASTVRATPYDSIYGQMYARSTVRFKSTDGSARIGRTTNIHQRDLEMPGYYAERRRKDFTGCAGPLHEK